MSYYLLLSAQCPTNCFCHLSVLLPAPLTSVSYYLLLSPQCPTTCSSHLSVLLPALSVSYYLLLSPRCPTTCSSQCPTTCSSLLSVLLPAPLIVLLPAPLSSVSYYLLLSLSYYLLLSPQCPTTCSSLLSVLLPAPEPRRGPEGGDEDAQQEHHLDADALAGARQRGAAHPRRLIPQEAQHLRREQERDGGCSAVSRDAAAFCCTAYSDRAITSLASG